LLATLPYGKRIIANVDSGHFEGPNIKETVQPPAGDCLLIRADNPVQLGVRVSLVTDDNTLIYTNYQGLRAGQQSVLDRLAAGEDVDSREYYMRTICKFETADGKYDWLNQLLAAEPVSVSLTW
jgi:hypothetical protein